MSGTVEVLLSTFEFEIPAASCSDSVWAQDYPE